ncbi:hypothetical protein [Glutamicibacter ardleyensis]|uniref:hypothetical protein n=1 Tax=Glutamicibacter ardleyensis TaxID=225894 RepID=UPI003FD34513
MLAAILTALRNNSNAKQSSAQTIVLWGTELLTDTLEQLSIDVVGERSQFVLHLALTYKMVVCAVIASMVAGRMAHIPRKPVLIGTDVIRRLSALCLPLVSEAWQIYVQILVSQSPSPRHSRR